MEQRDILTENMRNKTAEPVGDRAAQNPKKALELSCDIDDILSYAAIHNGARIVRDVCIRNLSDADMEELTVRICSRNLTEELEFCIEKILPGEALHFKNLNVSVNADYLVTLTEKISDRMTVSVWQKETEIISESKKIEMLAFDQWPGLSYTPELLNAFVMPNHPVIAELLQLAADYLNKWTGNPSLAGYQFKDPNRVKSMAAAAYAAIQQKNITYAEPPASFEALGQRIRLADAVLDQHLGTCMDMTLLYAACLEAMGLNPVMVMMKGHIFAGVWLMEQSFSDMLMDDPSQLEKRMSKGIHELIVVECTAMCAGKTKSFDEAVLLAQRRVADYAQFAFVIDVKRARSMGIRPLPVRVRTEGGFAVLHEERGETEVTGAPAAIGDTFDLQDFGEKQKATRQMQWERKLLDLSLRNMLINMRMTRAVVPLLASDVSMLEDALSEGEEFQVLPRPEEMSLSDEEGVPVEALGNLGIFKDFIALESRHRKLHSIYSEKELGSCLTRMYRSARTSMEENGASTLYLALGLLRWFEGKEASPRYAPIVLVPIDIIRKSANKGYMLRMRDEDAQINITLMEFLKQNYDLQIYGLNPPPTDECGLDLPKIFAIIRHAVMNLSMWDVVEAGFIGNFSFSQFVMWNDIHSRSDFLENNKIVHSLMSGGVEWDCRIPESVDTEEAYLPVPVDASQLRAINMAAAGVSFVLHGPPGTGKSQTITGMVANALTKGKTVLFVAEKKAALEVVQKRLASLGIQDFCLELHSNKVTKRAVLDQLRRGLEIGVQGTQTDYDTKIQDIRRMRADLDDYARAIHEKRAFGKSLRQLIDIYEMIPRQGHDIRFDRDYAASLTEKDLDNQTHSLERLIAAGREIGHPHNHPLAAVHKAQYSQQLKFDLKGVLLDYRRDLQKLRERADVFAEWMGLAAPGTKTEWIELFRCAGSLVAAEEIPAFLLGAESVDREFDTAFSYLSKKAAFDAKRAKYTPQWNENFLRMDMESLRRKYDSANGKIFGKNKALAALTAEIQAYALFPVKTEKIPVYLTDVSFYQREVREMEKVQEALPYEWKEILKKYPDAKELQAYRDSIKRQRKVMSRYEGRIHELEEADRLTGCQQKAKELIGDWNAFEKSQAQAVELLELSFDGGEEKLPAQRSDSGEESWLESRLGICDCILENESAVKDWIVYRQFEKECRESGLGPVCSAYEAGLPHDEVMFAYLESIYRAIILSVIESEPALNGFTGTGFNERIAQFKKLDQEFMDLTREEMFYQLIRQLPTAQTSVQVSRELNILRRAISSNGRGISIRSLFEQIPTILPRFCPCMLMSPISAAQYLKAENDLFDIVIFDEASQLPTCKAVGVLARGRDAVIVGDPNQMPPTSFFAGNTVDEDNLDIEDLDSILDDCLALGMPQSYLRWHYRSRHESLIAFSNQEFYENSMYTFPSVNDREKRVSLVKVEGFFDRGRGRVNEGEARAIVAEIRRRYQNPKLTGQTVGVVTFNITQQTLIEDLLQEEYQKDTAFDRWANAGEEPLFVKNLENVQGDERDVILFSIAFGPDGEGKLSLNFGPLNKEGGWKRLNVAVSRARSEMVVFTTMTGDMISLKRTKSKGVESLKNFLEFAEKGKLQGEYAEKRVQKDQGILEHICQQIGNAGFTCQKAVGHSRFKVDIAVVNPYNEEEYLLGIMLDGESYRQSANTKDREVAQISVLKGLGWELHRVWTMDWWDNREKEIAKLLNLLEEKKEAAYRAFLEERAKAVGFAESVVEAEEVSVTAEAVISEEAVMTAETVEEAVSAEENAEAGAIQGTAVCGGNSEEPVLIKAEEVCNDTAPEQEKLCYLTEPYIPAEVAVTELSAADYAKKENLGLIAEKMQQIIDAESPIAYDRLIRKTLRAFHIVRSSPQTLEATEKALKKTSSRMNKQAGIKFYWRKDQDPELYRTYRIDANSADKRSVDEICQQELKNAVCATLQKKGKLGKDSLVKETIRTMGYGRSSAALVSAVERGLKYGRKTGEVVLDEEEMFGVSEQESFT